jgi:hypothetical protein
MCDKKSGVQLLYWSLALLTLGTCLDFKRMTVDHICSLTQPVLMVDPSPYITTSNWSIGFWFKVPAGQSSGIFFAIKHLSYVSKAYGVLSNG